MDCRELLEPIQELHNTIRNAVVFACEYTSQDEMATVADDGEGDTIYSVDRVSEEMLVEFFEREIAPQVPIVLIAEGIHGGKLVLPRGTREEDALFRIIVDPIDGTRGLMYQKRPAWILTGIAPNKGPGSNLKDIEVALMTEVPLIKQHLSDSLWAQHGKGIRAERYNRITKESQPLTLRPSKAKTIEHGYVQIARFFPGVREELAAIDEEIVRGAIGPVTPGKALCFEDQYISTGGQLYELIAGRDRFTADIRPLMEPILQRRGLRLGICCHPYDLCTELIAREAGVIITKPGGGLPDEGLAVEPDVAWVGYANEAIRATIEPLLNKALKDRQLL